MGTQRGKHYQGQVAPERSCLGFMAQTRYGGHEGTNSHSESQKPAIVDELEYIIGPGPWNFVVLSKQNGKKEKNMSVVWLLFLRNWK